MLKVTVKDLVAGKQKVFYGEPNQVKGRLRQEFPETERLFDLQEIIAAIHISGRAEVEVVPYVYQAPPLPSNYLTHEESEDPWVREN